MNAGPTVRRLHRERAIRENAEAEARQRRARERPAAAPPPRTVVTVRQRAPTRECGVAARRKAQAEAVFPFSVADVLGLGDGAEVLVKDGRVFDLRRVQGSGEDAGPGTLLRHGALFELTDRGPLDTLVRDQVKRHLGSVRQWVAGQQARPCDLDRLPGFGLHARTAAIDAFVHERLIPCIDAVCASKKKFDGPTTRPPAAGEDADDEDAALSLPLPGWEGRFAFFDGRWLSLVPFAGAPGPRDMIHVDGELHLVLETLPASLAVAACDERVRAAVREAFRQEGAMAADSILHRRGPYTVHRTGKGRYFVARTQPAYVVEAADERLYAFSPAEVGIEINGVQGRHVLHSQSALVLHRYPHMFVHTYGFICMPRPMKYYGRLAERPLEEALLTHLEEARLTLCAGYMPNSAAVHPIEATGRPVIELAEARRRGLPIYWYDRSRRRWQDKAKALV